MEEATETRRISPQPKQQQFLACSADIAGYGGSAGSGKTFAGLLEPLRHIHTKKFRCVIFRRTTPEITNPGGLWDESMTIYPDLQGYGQQSKLQWSFPSGARIKFSHMEYERTKLAWQGAAITLIIWEEMTHFTRSQFLYMLSRNRCTSGIKPYIRFTCNPDADSWVAEFIAWWIGDDGYIIPERAGVIRYFTVQNDEFIWGATRKEVVDLADDVTEEEVKSFTFIPAKLSDNQELLKVNPEYLGNLKALSHVEQERLLHGNWKIRPAAGLYFKEENFQHMDPNQVPEGTKWVRCWDLAATTEAENNKSARTAHLKIGRTPDGRTIVCDPQAFRKGPADVEAEMLRVAKDDGYDIAITFPQDPGQAGKAQARQIAAMLSGYEIYIILPQGDKIYRARGFSAQAGAGNVYILPGENNKEYKTEMSNFPEAKLKDWPDASSDGFNHLAIPIAEWASYDDDEEEEE